MTPIHKSMAAIFCTLTALPVLAADLYTPGNWPALASDRRAAKQGDLLTILVYEAASAKNSANSGTRKNNKFDGRVSAGSKISESVSLSTGGSTDNSGTTGRSGQMVAQISAVIDEVRPNGDLIISGSQQLNINGDHTFIRIKGRIRPSDISSDNAIMSNRIADAMIDYDGSGFVARGSKPGLVTRVFNWLGVL